MKRKELQASRQTALQVKPIRSDTTPAEFAATSVARPQVVAKWVAYLTRQAARRASRSEDAERAAQIRLLYEIIGNPFRPTTLEPAWLSWCGGAIVKIAQAIHEGGTYAELPILADALEEAGCGNSDILAHCREPGEHVRGCWVVDLFVEKG